MIEISSRIVPYTDPEEFWTRLNSEESGYKLVVETNNQGTVDFTGKYDGSLMDEIYKYSVVASVIAQENDFDIIHAHDWLAYPAGIAAMEVSGKPLVIHVHATDFDRSGGNVNPDVYRIEKLGMDAASKIITVSNLTRDIVINKYNINPDKVETVYNAVEPVKMSQDVVLSKGFDDKVVTFLGRITLQKGPEYFIEAAYKVLKAMPDVRFVMAGSGDMMEKMMRRAAALKITDRFHFTGFLKGKDVFTMLNMSDVYIMPSVSEPFGISPLEAMQSNVPVIISKQSGVSEILTHAVKTDFWDIDAMADAIYGILNYPALSKMFIKNGREEVVRLKWDNSARHVRDIYYRVIWQNKN
jgi:glycosyltransferase involved in cell wall biosynthesis